MIYNRAARVLRSLLRPEVAVRAVLKRFKIGSLDFRLDFQALEKNQYAFGVRQAIYLASKLNHRSVSVIEFGVDRGAGLLALELYAAEYGRRAGIDVEVYGFDLGSGLPSPSDYRDLGYVWKKGAYTMDVPALQSRLTTARLVLGNVADTVTQFIHMDHAPVGFMSFDMDYYTSTVAAFEIFRAADRRLLPRVFCYFDDIDSDGHQMHCEDVGELLAIREFNEQSGPTHKLRPTHMLTSPTLFEAPWGRQFRVYHRFTHADYNSYIGA
ncbi:MAG: hypothetical protein ABI681_12935 [Gemmatimonadales bacterium]